MVDEVKINAPESKTTLAVVETVNGNVISEVKATPFYKRWHVGGSYALGFVAVCGVIGTMTGPPPFISKDVWGLITFAAIIVATFFKGKQSSGGSTAIAIPKAISDPPSSSKLP